MSKIKSRIYMSDVVINTEPHPLANSEYIHVYVIDGDDVIPAMLTQNEINRAITRADRNKEDQKPKKYTLWEKIKFWLA